MDNSLTMAFTQLVELGRAFLTQRVCGVSKLNQCEDDNARLELAQLYGNEIDATANVIKLFTGREFSFQWRKGAGGEDWGGFSIYEIAEDAPCEKIPCGVRDTRYSRYSGKQEPKRILDWEKGMEKGKMTKVYELVYDKDANPCYVGGYLKEIG